MKISIIGYGKMGREIDTLAREMGIEISSIIDTRGGSSLLRVISKESVSSADVCIDFTEPGTVLSNIFALLDLAKPIVVGTTGWFSELNSIKERVNKCKGSLIYSPNFSVGMVLFQRGVSSLSSSFGNFREYDCSVREIHHRMKKDAPSGTAISLSNEIISNSNKRAIKIVREKDEIKENDLVLSYTRVGWNPGEHEIIFDSEFDTVSLKHTVRSRRGFALGALLAAKWIIGKKGIYNFIDCFDEICKRESNV